MTNPIEMFKQQNEGATNSGLNPLYGMQEKYKQAGEQGIETEIPNNWLIKLIQQLTNTQQPQQQRPETIGSMAQVPEQYLRSKNFWSNIYG